MKDVAVFQDGYDYLRNNHPRLLSVIRVFIIALSLSFVHYAGFFDNHLSNPFFVDVMLDFYGYFISKTIIYFLAIYYSSMVISYLVVGFVELFVISLSLLFDFVKDGKKRYISFINKDYAFNVYLLLFFGVFLALPYGYIDIDIDSNVNHKIYFYLFLFFILTVSVRIFLFNYCWICKYSFMKKYKAKSSFYIRIMLPLFFLIAYLLGLFHMSYLTDESKAIEFSNSYFHCKKINILMSYGDNVFAVEQIDGYKRYIYFKKDSFFIYNNEETPSGTFNEILIKNDSKK